MNKKDCPYFNYWKESVEAALEDAGINATNEQIDIVAKGIEGSHECYGLAFGTDFIGNPLEDRVKELEENLKREKNKTICPECKGSGRYVCNGPYHSSESQCIGCRGAGFIY